MLLYHILTFNVHGHTKIINFKYQLQHGTFSNISKIMRQLLIIFQ